MARQAIEIDRNKLRAAIRKLGDEYVFYMLDDAIDLLPPAKLHKIVRKYLDLKRLRPDSENVMKASLLADVKAFPEEYAQRIVGLLKHHYHYGSAKMLAAARKIATPAQRQAISKSEAAAAAARSTR